MVILIAMKLLFLFNVFTTGKAECFLGNHRCFENSDCCSNVCLMNTYVPLCMLTDEEQEDDFFPTANPVSEPKTCRHFGKLCTENEQCCSNSCDSAGFTVPRNCIPYFNDSTQTMMHISPVGFNLPMNHDPTNRCGPNGKFSVTQNKCFYLECVPIESTELQECFFSEDSSILNDI
ncbi:uncharacterized protein LOC103576059 [Microplitis demolitor]|uniref:uncharacterized protein LOC103576059 n=1 Tax=Microplitis demolitor TaxID=69319 RepID=UPI0004CC9777|nr:uncharacterized protein LOC103576059 [Microplitis demolitor]